MNENVSHKVMCNIKFKNDSSLMINKIYAIYCILCYDSI